MSASQKRLEELRHAHAKLKALAEAMVVVRHDSTAREILEEVLDSTADGTGTHVADMHDLVIIAYAHSSARVEVEQRLVAAREHAA